MTARECRGSSDEQCAVLAAWICLVAAVYCTMQMHCQDSPFRNVSLSVDTVSCVARVSSIAIQTLYTKHCLSWQPPPWPSLIEKLHSSFTTHHFHGTLHDRLVVIVNDDTGTEAPVMTPGWHRLSFFLLSSFFLHL